MIGGIIFLQIGNVVKNKNKNKNRKMKLAKKIFNSIGTLLVINIIISSCSGNNKKNGATENQNEIKLNNIKTGDILIFGEGCNNACDSIYIEFTANNKAKLFQTHIFEVNGNSGRFKKEQNEGEYNVEFLPSNAIFSDNEYWPIFDSVIVLSNDNYGYDHGYLYLSKRYAITKCKNKSSNEIQKPRIYEWLDPTNYPSRNGEYSFNSSILLNQIKIK